MIAIDKSAEEPERLQEEGERERAKLEKAYEDDSTDFASVLEERGFNRRIYSHSSVREALLDCPLRKVLLL